MMVASALILGETQVAALKHLRDKAAAAPIDVRAVLRQCQTPAGTEAHLHRMEDFTVLLPINFKLTFSIETGHPAGPCRHMSMSSLRHGRAPLPEAVWMACEALGFAGGLESCGFWLEDIGHGQKAVNVVQPLSVTASGATGDALNG